MASMRYAPQTRMRLYQQSAAFGNIARGCIAFLLIGLALALEPRACAQSGTSLLYTGGNYTQNFAGLPTATPSPDLTGNNVFAFGDPTIDATNMAGWYGQSVYSDAYYAGNGASANGGFYGFSTNPSNGTQALGLLGNTVTGNEVFGLRLINNTQSTVYTSLTISFTGEVWHDGSSLGATASMVFGYQDYANPEASLPTGDVNTNSNLAFTGTNTGAAGAVNGTSPANQTPLSATIPLASAWTPGESLWLTWSFLTPVDGSPGLGIANLSFAASGATAPDPTWTAASSSAWDTSSGNWNTGTYADGDYVIFNNAPVSGSNVVITAAGVTPGHVSVANDIGTYTFSGGPIGGSGFITKSGSGMLILSSSNSYSGGTVITGGVLAVSAGDNSLGASGSQVTFDGGQLQTSGTGIVSSRNFSIDSGGGSFNSNGFNSTTSGSITGGGAFTKIGAGDLSITGNVGAANNQNPVLSVLGGSLTLNQGAADYFNVPTTAGAFTGDLVLGANTEADIAGSASAGSPAWINGGGAILFSGSNAGIDDTGNTSGSPGYLEIDNNIVLNSGSSAQPFAASIGITTGTFADTLVLNGVISGGASLSFTGLGNNRGVILLDGSSNYTGGTTIDNGINGVVRLGVTNALPATTQLTFGVDNSSAGALDLNGFNQTLAGLSSNSAAAAGIINSSGSPGTLTISQATDSSYSGNIGNNINLVIRGPAALEVTNNNLTYTGYTQVNGGTLIVAGGITGSSGVSVNTSGTLAGVGGIIVPNGGNVTVNSGGAIAPGDNYAAGNFYNPTGSFSILDLGNSPSPSGTFDLKSGGALSIALGATSAGGSQAQANNGLDSQLYVQGTISLSGSLSVSLLNGFTANQGDLFFIIINQGSGAVSGAFANAPTSISVPGPNGIYTFLVGYHGDSGVTDNHTPSFTGGNDVVLEAQVIPEPGAVSSCLSGVALLLVISRRRRPR